jgi:hypothetical protein
MIGLVEIAHEMPAFHLNLIFLLKFQRAVNRDRTVTFQNLTLQIDPVVGEAPGRAAKSSCISTWKEP